MSEAYPLHWPAGVPRAGRVHDAPFKVTLGDAIKQVLNEVRLMGGTLPVLSTNLERRRDGLPYANQRQPEDCGVAVYFQRRGKPMVFACDRWRKIEHNLRAIAKTIEALRGIERWGTSDMVEQAYAGFMALPPPGAGVTLTCWAVLGIEPGADRLTIERAYRAKAKEAHPDKGGTRDAWDALKAAYDQALAA